MNKQTITFTADEQILTKTGGIEHYASNIVSYIEASFTLGDNWAGYDSIRAVWESGYARIATVLDANNKCIVPAEVLTYKSKVNVNLVGSIVENTVLTDRLTTYPILALTVDADARVDSSETTPVTASQFEQFVDVVRDEASAIQNYTYDSEAWAVGQRAGVDVPSTDETYHNNAKYYADQGATLQQEVTDLKSEINDIRTVEHTDLLYGQTVKDNWIINYSTGVGSSDNGYYSYELIPIPANAVRLFPYNNVSGSLSYIRSVCFYDNTETFISGVSGTATTVKNGISIPSTAKYVSCSLGKPSAGYDGSHYLSTNIAGDIVSQPLANNVEIDSSQIENPTFNDNNIRKACINFQFDDGSTHDKDIVDIFDSYNMRCGFALIANNGWSFYQEWLRYQAKGYEILSHSTDATGMNDASVSASTIETKLKNSKETLEGFGFKINGFVTPNSNMNIVFRPILRKYYQWAETIYYGDYVEGGNNPFMLPIDGVYNGWRVSLQGTTIANQKKAVDEAIKNYGCLTFYGHAAQLDGSDNLTTDNLNELLTYLQTKVSNGECIVETPTEVKSRYFSVRNDDISDGWYDVPVADVSLDARFTATKWIMKCNDKLKLLWLVAKFNPSEDVSGEFNLFTFPTSIAEDAIVQSDSGRNCIVYAKKLRILGAGTWTQGTSCRFSCMLKIS